MSDREKVKRRYHDAQTDHTPGETPRWKIVTFFQPVGSWGGIWKTVGTGNTAREAWADAAAKL